MVYGRYLAHFGHTKILQYQPLTRGHFKNIQDHDDCLIHNWNKTVDHKDIIIHVGDFAFGSREFCFKIRTRLNGNIFMIPGNHDSSEAIKKSFACFKESLKIKIDDWIAYCNHYAHMTWPNKHDKCIHCHGHSHGFLGHDLKNKRFDVGVDCWNLTPVSFDTLKNLAIVQEDYQI